MKKGIFIGSVVVAIVVLSVLTFASCTNSDGVYSYDDEHLFVTAPVASEGSVTDGLTVDSEITNLDIEWVSGKVEVVPVDTGKLIFNEKIKKFNADKDGDYLMRYRIDGGTLRIRFAKSGLVLKNDRLDDKEKTLTVYVPKAEGSSAGINKVAVKSVTAKVVVSGVAAKNITVDNVSGVTQIENAGVESGVKLASVSGSQKVSNTATKSLVAESISGYIDIVGNKISDVKVNTTSGYITLNKNESEKSDVVTMSGRVNVEYPQLSGRIDIETAAGNVNVKFNSEEPTFTIVLETTSGKLNSNLNIKEENGAYIYGNSPENYKINVKTVSGNLSINNEKTYIGG